MPRFQEDRTWKLLRDVPPHMFGLVREALALRQKIVLTRQSLLFLQRCKSTAVFPRFITNKKLGSICNLDEDHPRIVNIYRNILGVAVKQKQYILYSSLLKCKAKEESCRRLLSDRCWKAIERGSKEVCDSIRSRAKATLCAKYNTLRSEKHRNGPCNRTDSSTNHQYETMTTLGVNNALNQARVTLIGGTTISEKAVDFLNLGPSFSIAQGVGPSTYRQVVTGLHRLRDQLRRSAVRKESQRASTESMLSPIPFPCSFYKEPEPSPVQDVKFRVLSSGVLEIFRRHGRERFSNMTNAQWEGLREMRKRVAEGEIRLSVSDKGGEFVVLPRSLDREITELHLSDTSVYSHSTEKTFLTQCHRLNALWISIGKTAKLDRRLISRLKLDTPLCPVFYSLIKTHKLSNGGENSVNASDYKIRPIISCVGGPTDRISWFLNKIVGQLLRYVPSHLPNTNEFLDRLRSCRLQENCVVESFDVTALYTNVNNDEALQAVSEMLDEHGTEIVTFGLSKVHIMTLIKECLSCNIFKWSGQYFSQNRGLAMGQRLAPVLAICFMSRVERPVIARMPIMYCRYIDDCCVITSTQQEMDELFNILNRQSQYIKFTREVPHEGWLPYLNTQINISSGRYNVKWYRKGSSKNILLHSKSAHPEAVKRAVVRNMYRTATGVCTGEVEREESRKLASGIANLNGYGTKQRKSGSKGHPLRNHENMVHLRLPFISDKVSAEVRQCIARADLANDVVLINVPSDNIKRLLIRNRLYDRACATDNCVICPFGRSGDCTQRGTVYQLQCSACGEIYIGETGRMLGIRVKEHLAGKRRGSLLTPLGKHRLEDHQGEDFDIKCKILAYENEIGARKILEALYIRERNPKLNNRSECIAITSELLPFIPFCGL
ncbi:hypothetical protein V3C99_018027 [Haemonchus contortus]